MKKGFTLIELLAVIVILGVILSITFLSVNTIIKNSKESLSDSQKHNIEEAAKAYYLKEGTYSDNACVNLSDLINKGYIDAKEVKDPETKQTMTGSVKITYESNQYFYEYQSNSCE